MNAAQPAPRGRVLICALAALSGLGPFALDLYLPALPGLTKSLHTSAAAGELTLTACMIGIAFGQLIGGPISDARGRRKPLLIGLTVFTLSSLVCGLSDSILLLTVVRLVEGFSGGIGVVISRAVIRDHYDGPDAARGYAMLMAIGGMAPVIAPPFGGLLLKLTDWRGEFVALALLGALITLASAVVIKESLPPEQRHAGGLTQTLGTFGVLIRDRAFAPHAVSFSIAFGSMFAYISASSFVLENVYGVSPQLFGLIFAVNEVGLAIVAALCGRLLQRYSAHQLLVAGLVGVALASMVACICALTHATLWILLPTLFLDLSFNGLTLTNGTSVAMASQRGSLGSASALLGFAQFGTGAIVAPLVGLGGAHDAAPMGVVMCVCGLLALAIGAWPRAGSASPHA